MPPALWRVRGRRTVAAIQLAASRGAGREFQAACSHTEGLSLFCDVQQLDLPAGQDEVAVKLLWAPSAPFHATLDSSASSAAQLAFPSMLHFRGLEDIGGGVSETSSSADAQASSAAAPVAAQESAGLQGRRGGEGRGRQQVQLAGTLGATGIVVAVCRQEDLGGPFLIRQSSKICRPQGGTFHIAHTHKRKGQSELLAESWQF